MLPAKFETETCTRCGGSGRHSYCQRYADTCFKCGGSGKALTRRGRAASAFLNSLRSVPAGTIQVGDLIYWEAGFSAKSGFAKVTSVGPDTLNPGLLTLALEAPWLAGGASYGCEPKVLVRKGWTAAEKAAQRAQAMAYQASLTKQGKPRKRQVNGTPA